MTGLETGNVVETPRCGAIAAVLRTQPCSFP
jgi:hypothetical protein